MIQTAIPWRLETHQALASTSDLCRAAAQSGAPEGLAIRADRQTAGRGTNGRTWTSPPGNLYLSILLRPEINLREAGQYALLAGLATAEALAPHAPARLTLKWPNDILLEGAKLAGMLIESAATGPNLDWLILGIGANLAVAPNLPDRPTANLPALSPATAAHAILSRLDHWETVRRVSGFAPIRLAWTALSGVALDKQGKQSLF